MLRWPDVRWPWTSVRKLDALQVKLDVLTAQQLYMVDREAFNLVINERDRLREQVDTLMNHTKRMDRIEHGLNEEERKQRESLGKMPFDLQMAFKGYRPAVRKLEEQWAWNQRRSGRTWEEITAQVLEKKRGSEG